MATYEEILAQNRKDQNAKAEEEYKKRAAANTEIANTYISDMNTIVDNAAQQSAGKIQKEIDALPTAYQSAFDANAIQQKINEREVRERMANLGLTDSGLNRTQQTAINIQRANADAALVQQKNVASNSLKQQIADIYASAENQKLEYAAKANSDLKSTNESLRQGLFDAAESNAITVANNWLDNETTKQKALIEQETAKAKAAVDAKKTSKNLTDEIFEEAAELYTTSADVSKFKSYLERLRLMGYTDEQVGNLYHHITSNYDSPAYGAPLAPKKVDVSNPLAVFADIVSKKI